MGRPKSTTRFSAAADSKYVSIGKIIEILSAFEKIMTRKLNLRVT